MKTRLILATLIVLFVISFTFFLRVNQSNYQSTEQLDNITVQAQNSTTSQQNQNSGKIPFTELSGHNSLEDCWIAYDGKVYDITSYLPRHPGSAGKILPYCGSATEFEQAFTKKHGTSKVSTLMKVGTFIGDFDVMGNLENLASSNSPQQNENSNQQNYDDDEDDDNEDAQDDDDDNEDDD